MIEVAFILIIALCVLCIEWYHDYSYKYLREEINRLDARIDELKKMIQTGAEIETERIKSYEGKTRF